MRFSLEFVPTYDWFYSLNVGSITCFNDIEDVFFNIYTNMISYHTLFKQFTQIQMEKNEKIKDFNLNFS
jgi:hypothetical protein